MTLKGGASRVRNESDPHIVTGVLQKTLKELSPSPLFEVYEDILSTEISEDSIHSRILVQSWLVKLPQDRFELVSSIVFCISIYFHHTNILCAHFTYSTCFYHQYFICTIILYFQRSVHSSRFCKE